MTAQITAKDLGLGMDYMQLTLDLDRGVARLTLDRVEKLNTITMPQRKQLAEAFRVLDEDGRARVIIICGAGNQGFSAGGDIPGFLETGAGPVSLLHEHVAAPERFPGPVIAAVDGYCFGVGLELALACDFLVATSRAVFAQPEIRLGMIPGSGGSQRMIRMIGLQRTKDMVLRGRRVPAAESLAWGFVTQVVEPDALLAAADALADELLAQPRLALETAKRVLNAGQNAPLDVALQLEGYAYGMLRGTQDFAEGVRAFAEKRPPRFQGR